MVFNTYTYLWLHWVSIALQAFSSCGEQKLLRSCSVQASYCSGFSCCRTWALGARAQSLWHVGLIASQHV